MIESNGLTLHSEQTNIIGAENINIALQRAVCIPEFTSIRSRVLGNYIAQATGPVILMKTGLLWFAKSTDTPLIVSVTSSTSSKGLPTRKATLSTSMAHFSGEILLPTYLNNSRLCGQRQNGHHHAADGVGLAGGRDSLRLVDREERCSNSSTHETSMQRVK